jgi:hypothetical protein
MMALNVFKRVFFLFLFFSSLYNHLSIYQIQATLKMFSIFKESIAITFITLIVIVVVSALPRDVRTL